MWLLLAAWDDTWEEKEELRGNCSAFEQNLKNYFQPIMCWVKQRNVSYSQPLQVAKDSKRSGHRAKVKSQALASGLRSRSTLLTLRQRLIDTLARQGAATQLQDSAPQHLPPNTEHCPQQVRACSFGPRKQILGRWMEFP